MVLHDIIHFLEEIGECVQVLRGDEADLNRDIAGIATVRDAVEGSVSWISPKKLRAAGMPQRFSGSLLICPGGVKSVPSPQAVLAVCRHPKLSIILVIQKFFEPQTRTQWPGSDAPDSSGRASIHPSARLAPGVVIGSDVVIEEDVSVGPNTVIANAVIGKRAQIGGNCSIGLSGFGFVRDETGTWRRFPHLGKVVIGEDVEIGSNTCIDRGAIGNTVVGAASKIDNLVHIAHNVDIGPGTLVIANSMIGGSSVIGRSVWIAPSVSLINQASVGDNAFLGMGSVVLDDVPEGATLVGNPARPLTQTKSGKKD